MLDFLPLAPLPILLLLPSSILPNLLPLRPGVEIVGMPTEGCLGVGSILVRRLVAALAGLETRRATGDSSLAGLWSSSAIITLRLDTGVLIDSDEEPGVVCMYALVLAGVDGDCIGLARGRRVAC